MQPRPGGTDATALPSARRPGAIEGRTFRPRNCEQMRAWIEVRQGKVGIDYSVNEGNTDKINVKLSKKILDGFIASSLISTHLKTRAKS